MSQAPTLLVPQLLNHDAIAVWRAAAEAGWEVVRVGGAAIGPELHEKNICVFGPLCFGDAMRAVLPLALIEPADDWLCGLPQRFLMRRVEMMSLAEARSLDTPAFIKPPRQKEFPAAVYGCRCEDAIPVSFGSDRQVIVAEPVSFEWEVRLFVLDRNIAASSPYSYQRKRPSASCPVETSGAALRFGRTLLEAPQIPIPPAVVIDVGFIDGRGWAVVEANPAWASTLYSANPSEVLPVLRRASWNPRL